MSHYHAVVWIDHHEARIFQFNEDEADKEVVHPKHPVRHRHHRAGSSSSWRAKGDDELYGEVAKALGGVGEILVTGPANAKLGLVKYLHGHAAGVADKVIGVETVDHPSDGQLLAYARNYFKAADRMLPQID